MALVIICGQPCSGKSTAAACLLKALGDTPLPVKLIDEPSLNLDRNQSYSGMSAEKNLRGMLRSEVDRSVSKESIVVVDSLNNIKGYRYELWCIARAAGIRYCLLYCDTGENNCRMWNNARLEQGKPSYDVHVFDDLLRRFEVPDERNRWDAPLFHLKLLGEEHVTEIFPVFAEIVAFLIGSNEPAGKKSAVLHPTVATQHAHASETNSLYELDRATQEVINALVEAQAQGLGGAMGKVDVGKEIPLISFHVGGR